MTEHRWSKFWWQDYEGDDALRLCSLAAQGLWMRMLCAMHRGTPYGHISVNGAPPTERQLALMVSATEREVAKLVPELEQAGVLSRSADGLIFSRRMVRDKAISDKAREDGKAGGNPALRPKGLTPPHNPKRAETLKPEAEAEAEADKKGGGAPRAASPPRTDRGSRLAADWQPSAADVAYAEERGVDWQRAAERFRNYWHGQAGAKGVKADWPATWRNWVLKDAEDRKRAPPAKTSHLSTYDQNAELVRLARESQPPALRLLG